MIFNAIEKEAEPSKQLKGSKQSACTKSQGCSKNRKALQGEAKVREKTVRT